MGKEALALGTESAIQATWAGKRSFRNFAHVSRTSKLRPELETNGTHEDTGLKTVAVAPPTKSNRCLDGLNRLWSTLYTQTHARESMGLI